MNLSREILLPNISVSREEVRQQATTNPPEVDRPCCTAQLPASSRCQARGGSLLEGWEKSHCATNSFQKQPNPCGAAQRPNRVSPQHCPCGHAPAGYARTTGIPSSKYEEPRGPKRCILVGTCHFQWLRCLLLVKVNVYGQDDAKKGSLRWNALHFFTDYSKMISSSKPHSCSKRHARAVSATRLRLRSAAERARESERERAGVVASWSMHQSRAAKKD
jgi:hypothetical protein